MDEESNQEKPTDKEKSNEDSRKKKQFSIFKMCVFLISLGIFAGLSAHCTFVVQSYLQFNSYFKTVSGLVAPLYTFPTVLICPRRPFGLSEYRRYGNQALRRNDNHVFLAHFVLFEDLPMFWSLVLYNESFPPVFKDRDVFIHYATLSSLIHSAGEEKVLFLPEDTILYCKKNDENCYYNEFEPIVFGNRACLEFSSDFSPQKRISNENVGLLLYFLIGNLDTSKRLITISSVDNVYFYQKGSWVETRSVKSYHPGQFEIKKFYQTDYKRLNLPEKKCAELLPVERCYLGRDAQFTCRNFTLTEKICESDVKQASLYKECGCVSTEWVLKREDHGKPFCFQLPRDAVFNNGYFKNDETGTYFVKMVNQSITRPMSSLGNLALIKARAYCFWDFYYKQYQEDRRYCNPKSCHEVTYEVKHSKADRTEKFTYNDELKKSVDTQLQMTIAANLSQTMYSDWYSGNYRGFSLTTLLIKPARDNPNFNEEELFYNLFTFLSDMAGVVGLWIGLSVISIFEFSEYIWKSLKMKIKHI